MAPASLSLQSALLAPLNGLAKRCADFRHCPKLSDDAWLTLGATRALHDHCSGRGFLQHVGPLLPDCPVIGHFFATLDSARRLKLCQQASGRVAQLLTDDPFSHLDGLRDFDLYAADGHWHGAAVYADPIDGAKRYLHRTGDGPPGFECLWKGYVILYRMVKIMRHHYASASNPRRAIHRT